MNEELLRDVVLNGPTNREERSVLAIMAALADNKRRVAISPSQIGKQIGLGEASIRHRLNRLIEEHWLEVISLNHWEIRGSTRAHVTRARVITNNPVELQPLNTSDASWRHQVTESVPQHRGAQHDGPRGSGQAASLGIENCPRCGGTGWEEVDSVTNGHPNGNFTVDVCRCRGGPSPKPTSTIPPSKPPRKGLDPEQMMTNLQGVERARQSYGQRAPLQDRPLVKAPPSDSG